MLVAGVVLSLLGVNSTLKANGVGLDLTSLLIVCGVYGFIGLFFSLFISKWMTKHATTNPAQAGFLLRTTYLNLKNRVAAYILRATTVGATLKSRP